MTVEQLLHAAFGNNLLVGPHIMRQLDCLARCLPPGFHGRRMDDLGCGDGRLTVLLAEIFEPVAVRGFDVNPALVRRARSRGIDARILDLEERMPVGDLGVIWGVLHHLRDPMSCILRVRANYGRAFVREPIRGSSPACFELGNPLPRSELRDLLCGSLPGARVIFRHDCAFAFYESPGAADPESTALRRRPPE